MTPSELRALMATAEHHPGETTEQYIARHAAEHQLSSWRVWLPGLLAEMERGDTPKCITVEAAGRTIGLAGALVLVGFCASEAESVRLVRGGGVRLNGQKTWFTDLLVRDGDKLSAGTKHHAIINFPIAPASQASGGAPAAVRFSPAGAHSSEVSQ